MTTLDTFARSAATAVTESVADVRAPIAGVGTATASAAAWRMFRYAAAGAAAGAAVVSVLVVAPAPEDETTHDTTPPTTAVVTTTVPGIIAGASFEAEFLQGGTSLLSGQIALQ